MRLDRIPLNGQVRPYYCRSTPPNAEFAPGRFRHGSASPRSGATFSRLRACPLINHVCERGRLGRVRDAWCSLGWLPKARRATMQSAQSARSRRVWRKIRGLLCRPVCVWGLPHAAPSFAHSIVLCPNASRDLLTDKLLVRQAASIRRGARNGDRLARRRLGERRTHVVVRALRVG